MADEPGTSGTPDDQDGATPPTDGPPSPPANDPATPPADGPPATGDPAKPDEDWKARSRTWEDRAKANKQAADKATAEATAASETLAAVRKAFGLDGADEEDPKTAAEKAAAERDAKDAELRTLRIERAAEKVGRKAGADVDALLDSRSFATGAAKLDPADDAFDDDLAALVDQALKANPRLKATTTAPAASATADMAGGGEQLTGTPTVDQAREERRKRRTG